TPWLVLRKNTTRVKDPPGLNGKLTSSAKPCASSSRSKNHCGTSPGGRTRSPRAIPWWLLSADAGGLMSGILGTQHKRDMQRTGFSRRAFGRFASLLAAGAALPFYNEPAMAQLSYRGAIPEDAVKIDANENPLGPCPEAAEAMRSVVQKGGRYLYDET